MNPAGRGKKQAQVSWWSFQVEKFSWFPLLVLQGITALFYWKSLRYPFQFDDVAHITKHFAIRYDNPLCRWWFNRRWVGDYLNRLNFRMNSFEPIAYRATNLVIHMLSGVLVYYLVLMICKNLERSLVQKYRHFIAFCTAGLFLLHPLQTQAVSYAIQARIEGLATFFILLNLFLFVRYAQSTSTSGRIFTLSFLAVTTIISCGTKEIFVLAPVFMFLVDYFFLSKSSFSLLIKQRWIFYLVYGLFFAALVAWYIFDLSNVFRFGSAPGIKASIDYYLHNQNNLGNVLTHDPNAHITSLTYFMSQFRAVMHYISLVFWPFAMSVEYDWKLANSFMSKDVLIPLAELLVIIGLAAYSIISRRLLLAGFGILWFLVALFPRSSFIPSAELVCDYKAYLAVIGVYMALAVLLATLIDWFKNSYIKIARYADAWPAYAAVLVFVFFPLGIATYTRNTVWSTAELFWADCAKKAPEKARTHNNYGVALCEAGKFEQAIHHYQKAIDLDAFYQDPCSNIAVAYTMLGKIEFAIAALEQAIKIYPNYPEAYNNMASIYIDQKKDLDKAEIALQKALALRPYYGKAFFNMARICEARNDYQGVFDNLKKASQGDLDTVSDVFCKLGQVCFKLQKFDEAVAAYGKVVQLDGGTALSWFNYANALHLNKQYEESCTIYKKLVEIDSKDHRYTNNLAESHFELKQYDKALVTFERMVNTAFFTPQILFRMAACHEKMKQCDKAKELLATALGQEMPNDVHMHIKQELARLDIQDKMNKDGKVSIKSIQNFATLASNKAA